MTPKVGGIGVASYAGSSSMPRSIVAAVASVVRRFTAPRVGGSW